MTLPQLTRKTAEKLLDQWCQRRNARASEIHGFFFYRFDGDAISLFEEVDDISGSGRSVIPRAQLRYHSELGQWSLHERRSDGSWRLCLNAPLSLHLGRLLRYVEDDPLRQFRD